MNEKQTEEILVIGGTGKTGRRVVQRLQARNMPVRIGSRSGTPSFDWEDPTSWGAVLRGVKKVYVTFYPDLAIPGTPDIIQAFTDLAVQSGVQRLVLLSGRGEEVAQQCEQIVQNSGIVMDGVPSQGLLVSLAVELLLGCLGLFALVQYRNNKEAQAVMS